MKSRIELNQDKQHAIDQEQKKEKQKKRVKIILKIMLIIFIFIFLLCLYVTKIGTTSLLVNETMISASNLPSSFHGLKVIQFSDVHYENKVLLEQTVAAINKRKPDLVFFTGDLLKDDNLSSSDRQDLTEQLKKITTTIGKYAVLGETDNEEAISILIDCGFTILNNNYELIYKNSNQPLLLIGLNTNDTINYEQAFAYYQQPEHNEDIYSIVLFHHPDTIDEILEHHAIDLALAGHSHGGEVNLFGLTSLAKKEGASKYDQAFYTIENTEFYISSGLGTSDYPYRFCARPSINFFRFMRTA